MHRFLIISLNTIQGFVSPIFNFLIVAFGIKVFGKANWASLIDVMIWVFLMAFIFGWGNRDHLLRVYSKQPAKIFDAFFSNICSRAFLLPLGLLFLLFYPFEVAIWAVLLVVLIFCYSSLSTLVIQFQKFGHQLLSEIIGFTIIIASIFLISSFDLIDFLKIYTLSIFIKILVLSIGLNIFKTHFSVKISAEELKAGFPFFILGLSGWLTSKSDVYLVSIYLEKSQLAEYQLLITAFLMLQALSAYITMPFTKHIYRVSENVLQKIKYKLYAVAIPLALLGGFAIGLVMELFMELNFEYHYYLVGALMALPSFFYTINIMELIKKHEEKTIIYISFFAFFFSITLIFLLIKTYEIFGVLLSVCITQWMLLIVFKLQRHYSKKQ